ncbi:MAG: hypothetical protein KDJ45_05470 [Hyphomicrobiaceae bacterium]|nr:hypothetical protein [Hyphomicrobiaceae bacterium]
MPEYDLKQLLLTELLAMDVYHRGRPGGLVELVGGLPQLDGVVEVVGGESDPTNAIGFFAKAYQKDGMTYIVYRGTDDGSLDVINNFGSITASLSNAGAGHPDLYYGYPVAICSLSSVATAFDPSAVPDYNSHLIEAVKFYYEIKKSTSGPIVLVGQSLGGGLAGFVGALLGIETYLYNPAPFKLAVENAYWWARGGIDGPDGVSLRQFLYRSEDPPPLPSFSNVKGAYVGGEIIEVVSTRPYEFEQKFSDFDPDGTLGLGGRHTA